jgi:hypothetical protein
VSQQQRMRRTTSRNCYVRRKHTQRLWESLANGLTRSDRLEARKWATICRMAIAEAAR